MDLAQQLTARREQAVAYLSGLQESYAAIVAASEASNADDEHDPEGATIGFERAQVAALIEQATATVTGLDGALARIADGSYGTCEQCGQRIASERLEARPAAQTCIACASADRSR